MLRVSLSDGMTQTVLLPGGIALSAIAVGFYPELRQVAGSVEQLVRDKFTSEQGVGVVVTGMLAIGSVLAYLVAIVLGAFLAIIISYIEVSLFDSQDARKLGLTDEMYSHQWYRYVDQLEQVKNSFISKQVTAFLFESRMALALLPLGFSFLRPLSRTGNGELLIAIFVALSTSSLLWKSAADDHYALAAFRNRRYSEQTTALDSPELILDELIDRWLIENRRKAILLILPHRPEKGARITDPEAAKAAIAELQTLPEAELSPTDKARLGLVEAILAERIR